MMKKPGDNSLNQNQAVISGLILSVTLHCSDNEIWAGQVVAPGFYLFFYLFFYLE
jgi:hypothetical protein